MRRLLLALLGALAAVLVAAGPASAHPLGNFTVNVADQITLEAGSVQVLHVLDLAEIPTVQLTATADRNGDGRLSAGELAGYADTTCRGALSEVSLTLDGTPASLNLVSANAVQPPGQAGLPTTRVQCTLRSDRPAQHDVALTDSAATGRVGWHEVTATARCGRVVRSDVPAGSPSALLTRYPADLLTSPLQVRAASLTVAAGPCGAAPDAGTRAERTALPRGLGGLASSVTGFLGRPALTLPFALLSVLAALAFGAVHALAPGHGKTVLAAYLVGQRGTRRQALQLGAVVTFTHTASVLVLGTVLAIGAVAAPERVVPATEVLSGVLLAAVGLYLAVLAIRRRRGAYDHDHPHALPHDHPHALPHDHPHALPHDPPHDHAHPHHADPHHAHAHPHHAHPQDDHGHHDDDVPLGDHLHDHDHPHPALPTQVVPAQVGPGRERPVVVLAATSDRPAGTGGVAVAPAPVELHSHGGRPHSHALPDGPLTWRTLAGMGLAGGLVPSPSALVVLLGAVYLGRAWFGVVLVLAYGVGMAATLTAAGLLLLRARSVLELRGWAFHRSGRLARLLPLLTAAVVVLVGLGLAVRGVLAAQAL